MWNILCGTYYENIHVQLSFTPHITYLKVYGRNFNTEIIQADDGKYPEHHSSGSHTTVVVVHHSSGSSNIVVVVAT